MKIALDWDETFTKDPVMWVRFVRDAIRRKHQVRIVTFRHKDHTDDIEKRLSVFQLDLIVMATGGVQKRKFCAEAVFFPDVWIDDSPEFIV